MRSKRLIKVSIFLLLCILVNPIGITTNIKAGTVLNIVLPCNKSGSYTYSGINASRSHDAWSYELDKSAFDLNNECANTDILAGISGVVNYSTQDFTSSCNWDNDQDGKMDMDKNNDNKIINSVITITNHALDVKLVYYHHSSATFASGTSVTAGQKIGTIGNIECSSGNHIHFEVHRNSTGARLPYSQWRFVSSNPGYSETDLPDFNGDGKQDIIEIDSENRFFVGLSNGSNLFSYNMWIDHGGSPTNTFWKLADFNGDNKTDLILQNSENRFYVGLSNGVNGFNNSEWYDHGSTPNDTEWKLGDFNADGKADLILRNSENKFYVNLSNGINGFGFNNIEWIQHGPSYSTTYWDVADFNGDNKTDLILQNSENKFYVGLSNGVNGFNNWEWVDHGSTPSDTKWKIGDFNNDNKTDLILQNSENKFYVGISNGSAFTGTNVYWVAHGGTPASSKWDIADFNRDGRLDLLLSNSFNQFYVNLSTGSSFENSSLWITQGNTVGSSQWKLGDFNGDGRSDLALRNTDLNEIWVGTSNGSSFSNYEWVDYPGSLNDGNWKIGDYTGDSRMDILFVNSTNDFDIATLHGNGPNVIHSVWFNGSGNTSSYKWF